MANEGNKTVAQFKNGLIFQNPTLVLLLGMCPTLAVTTSLVNGLGMGLCATAVLVFSNAIIAALRNFIPSKIRIAAYIVIIAGLVTVVDLLLQAYAPELAKSLGLFIPLIVVNCIILARAESYASKNPVGRSMIDGLTMGLGFTFALIIVSVIREVLGNGSILGYEILPSYQPALMMILPPGGFLTLGFVIAAMQKILSNRRRSGKM